MQKKKKKDQIHISCLAACLLAYYLSSGFYFWKTTLMNAIFFCSWLPNDAVETSFNTLSLGRGG